MATDALAASEPEQRPRGRPGVGAASQAERKDMIFRDRRDAGQRLTEGLAACRGQQPIVLALPRGGVVVGYEVARALDAPLDVVVTRKLGAPHNPEFGFGAVGPGGVQVLDEGTVRTLGLDAAQIERIAEKERKEMERRQASYRGERPLPDVSGRAAIVVDDGLATGVTAIAAVRAVRQWGPARLVLAVPVSAPGTAARLRDEVDELVCLHEPSGFMAVGRWYEDFSQASDEEVLEILARARSEHEGGGCAAP